MAKKLNQKNLISLTEMKKPIKTIWKKKRRKKKKI